MDQVVRIKRPPNPLQNASILSRILYWYTLKIISTTFFKKTLDDEYIPENANNYKASTLSDKLQKCWKNQKLKSRPSLWLAIGHAFGFEFAMLGGAVCFDHVVLRPLRSLSLVYLIKYFSNDQEYEISKNEAYMCGSLLVALTLLSSFFNHLPLQYLQLLGMKIRIACSSLIYRKSLKLSKAVLEDVSIGHITNLLSNDLSRVDTAVPCVHYLWIAPLQIVVVTSILYNLLGPISTIGVAFITLWFPLVVYLGKKCSKLRRKTAVKTDERIQLMNEIITGIKIIKMYTWENPFVKLVDNARRAEIRQILAMGFIRGLMKLTLSAPKMAVFITIIIYVLTGNSLTALYVFAIAGFYDNIRITLIVNSVYGAALAAELHVTIKRIEKFLLLEEIKRNKATQNKIPIISLQETSARWSGSVSNLTLNKVSITIDDNQLVGIVGPVGSGKSSILQVILGELPVESGTIKVNGKISYASQDPWVFSGNIQQNILFGQPMDSKRYEYVLKACALEEDLSVLPYADQTLVGERGVILSGGQKARVSLARAIYKKADIYLLDDPFSAVDIHVANHIFQECINTFLSKKIVVLITHQLQFLNYFHCIHLLENGLISASGTYESLMTHKSEFSKLMVNLSKNNIQPGDQTSFNASNVVKTSKGPELSKEQKNTGSISSHIYLTYFKSGGSILLVLAVFASFFLLSGSFTCSDYFTAYWVNQEEKVSDDPNIDFPRKTYVYVYTGITLLTLFATVFRTVMFYVFSSKVSIRLHNKMFTSMVNTSMAFFYINHSGRILNRFSNDVGIIDETIPAVLLDFIQCLFHISAAVIVISIVNPWLTIVAVVLSILVYFMRLFYMTTSQSLIRHAGTARSPVYAHLNETLQGLTTARAFGAETILQEEFDNHQDFHTSIRSLFISCSRTFSFYLDTLCIIYIAAIIMAALLNHTEQYAGDVGLAVTQAMALLGMFQWGMVQSTEIQNNMTSVERVVEYTNLPLEDGHKYPETSTTWPEKGDIKFESLSLKYLDDQPYVLKNINMIIEANQKIGIVGRTGAGKTSIITALFQLVKTEGSIYVDNINITKISNKSLRSKISIIPQDPVLFSGTIRRNLDPFGNYSDVELWSALDDVQLKITVSKLPLGLDHVVSDEGVNFSVGQRQLICLARAIIRRNKILVLDEATANVDFHTDTLIQNTIRRKFVDCTVLTIAHRLNTIMDSDKVLVIDAGEVVEYDHPYVLLKNENGIFYSMVQKTGKSMAKFLSQMAENTYNNGATKLITK